ncbi:antiviral innate immune response receptor RIG-I [Bombina bombina]|uniref:antiviral innate immune response receptor RIG-I n=1 Tax=Bombina bombina TaxID=8345 RepID=UPI00235A9BDF|nr:antiviral innate immune response receptor RIG-I [Bombina bombina]
MSQEKKERLKLFRSYIEKIIRPTYVLGYLNTWLPDGTIEIIKAEEQKSPTAAAAMFVEKLLELDADGWYQGFIDALSAAGYTGLYEALGKSDFSDIEKLTVAQQHLSIINSTVKNIIIVEEFVNHFNDCLLRREIEEIRTEAAKKGATAGAEKLIECLLRSDKKEWPKTFTLALERENHTQIIEVWSPENMPKKVVEEQDEETSTFSTLQFSEEPEMMLESAAPNDNATFSLPVTSSHTPKSVKDFTLRKYQEELAQCAYSGKNTIICAPTGSGKTFVSLAICDHHLKSIPDGQKGKVVFMATKVPVYEQQKDVFSKYYEGSRYTVVGFSGESSECVPMELIIKNNDIIVLTPQILVNCIDQGYVSSLSMFTLMIFDECHNTIGNHPYNVLMFNYMDIKFNSPGQKLPQIIGLTASVGTGKSKSVEEAMIYISKLCASLDTEVISTVKEHLDDLQKVVYKPEKSIKEVSPRGTDPFKDIMSTIMMETEEMAKEVYPDLDSISNNQNRGFGTQLYEQWIVGVQQKCRLLQMENKEEERRICSAMFTFTNHLRKYNDSIMINDDARTQDALEYLETFIYNVKNGSYNQIEQQLTKRFEANLPKLTKIAADNQNPKLEELEFILGEAYHENAQTRTLLFVKTRALVTALKKWVEDTPSLSFLKPEMLIGRSRRQDNTGMTFTGQKGVLDAFKTNGESKMLIATSVADEGIDIPACNLVLLYEYVGNVTKMIQVRGRGRAQDSKCFLVTCKRDQAEREKNNILYEKMMNDAVAKLQELDERDFLNLIRKSQQEEKNFRDFKKYVGKPKPTESNKRLLCGKCKTFVCNTDDIRTIQGSHHTVIDKSFKDRYITEPHPKPRGFQGYTKKFKLFCKKPDCKEDWGVSGTYQTSPNIPLIKISSFVVENAEGTNQEYFSRWVKVNFTMKEFSSEEMESFSV